VQVVAVGMTTQVVVFNVFNTLKNAIDFAVYLPDLLEQ
jgi:hypothetical protein